MSTCRLVKNSQTRGESTSIKFKIGCQDKITVDESTSEKWLTILMKIKDNILQGFFSESNKVVVIKFEKGLNLQKDYKTCEVLFKAKIPNIIKYYCFFHCNDSPARFTNLPEGVSVGKHMNFCFGPGKEMGFVVMPFYPIGSIKNYAWTPLNLGVLRNVLTQSYLALVCAYQKCGFVHKDLHLDNILLRKSEKKQNTYNNVTITLMGMYPLIMDFGRVTLNGSNKEFYTSMQTMFSLLRDIGDQTTVILNPLPVINCLEKLKSDGEPVVVSNKLLQLISKIAVDYEKRL